VEALASLNTDKYGAPIMHRNMMNALGALYYDTGIRLEVQSFS